MAKKKTENSDEEIKQFENLEQTKIKPQKLSPEEIEKKKKRNEKNWIQCSLPKQNGKDRFVKQNNLNIKFILIFFSGINCDNSFGNIHSAVLLS